MESQVEFDLWDDLLNYIRDGRVVPIVGAGVLVVNGPDGPVNLYKVVADELASRWRVPLDGLSGDVSLDDVVSRYLAGGGKREHLYNRITSILNGLKVEAPQSLRQLAEIREFKFFLSTTWDSMVETALREVRPKATVRTLEYTPSNIMDLPAKIDPNEVFVYHLLGLRSSAPTFALTQEDLLEFVYAMHKDKPVRLFHELSNHHLLFIGTGFHDWLARVFIRLTKGMKLSQQRDCQEFLADPAAGKDKNLVTFLRQFSKQTEIYFDGSAAEFVGELHRRYIERFPAPANAPASAVSVSSDEPPADEPVADGDGTPAAAVFLSYATEDMETALSLRDMLHGAGIDVWFDKRQLGGGDAFNTKIRRNIKDCALFIPLISATTVHEVDRYFRKEWRWANERAEQIADDVPFIIPTAIDDTPATEEARVPEQFLALHWERLAGGRATPDYAQRIKDLLRKRQSRRGAKL